MQKKQFGRSMIEMLGVLAIIGVLSIGGLLGYRRAVNNHQANVILDDVNRFAFVILERSGLALDAEIDKGDFVESGIYTLTAHQAAGANQFSILVQNVPEGVCEPLVDKANIDYKVGVVAAGGSVDDEVLYDTLHTDLCQEVNDIAFYFGDTSAWCNEPDESGYTPCTVNSDCCGGEFCWYPNDSDCRKAGIGQCKEVKNAITSTMSDGKTWTYGPNMNWWSAQNWCEAQGKQPVAIADIGCSTKDYLSACHSSAADAIKDKWAIIPHLWLATADNCSGWRFCPICGNWIDVTQRCVQNYGRAFCH